MITRMAKRPEQELRTRARRLGYLIGAGIVLVVSSAGVLGWAASGGERTQTSAWLGSMVLVLAGLGVVAAAGAVVMNRAAEKTRAERLTMTRNLILAVGQRTGAASREQASSVASWYVETPDAGGVRPRVAFRNASQLPVSRVRVIFSHAGDQIGALDLGVLPPNAEPTLIDVPDDCAEEIAAVRGSRDDLAAWQPDLDLLFFDAAGEVWWRTSAGVLKNRAGRGTASERWEEHPEGTTVASADAPDPRAGD